MKLIKRVRRLAAGALGASLALASITFAACDESDDAQFACSGVGFCVEYYGPARYVASIRDATQCAAMGHTETDACPDANGSACTLPRNGSTGVGTTQVYYDLSAEDIESTQQICASFGGTFEP